ncbi:MAG: 30S ribosomal protein S27ae [Nanoarchaeota archaeon]
MGKKAKPKNKVPSKRWTKYKVSGGKLEKAPSCPKCGEGTFLAQHKDRLYCGLCHYVEIRKQK